MAPRRQQLSLTLEMDPATTTATSMPNEEAIWEEFMSWAKRMQIEAVRDGKTREALAYLIKHEEGLRRYCEDGRLPISNILSKHVAKTVAVGRNYVQRPVMRSGGGVQGQVPQAA